MKKCKFELSLTIETLTVLRSDLVWYCRKITMEITEYAKCLTSIHLGGREEKKKTTDENKQS